MLLPGCDRCGNCGCVCGKLPYTLTVTFAGLKNRTHTTYCPLAITSNFGCGAAAVATSPGGCDDSELNCGASSRGALTGVLVTEPGHDYARLGRKQPVLSISGSGTGATITPTLEAVDGTLAEQCRSYKIASVTATGGTGYTDGETLAISVAEGTTITPAVAVLHTAHSEPTVTAAATGGSGAALAVTLSTTGSGTAQEWHVASVAVTDGGTGYTDGAAVTFSTTGTTVTAASGTITVDSAPSMDSLLGGTWDTVGGVGATVSKEFVASGGAWDLQATLTSGGSGYAIGDYIWWYSTGSVYYSEYTVTAVDGSGTITAISQTASSPWPTGPGPITGVTVDDGGAYHSTGTVPASVTVTTPGEYFCVDPTAPVCLANVTVSAASCGGTGAAISASIGSDPTNAATWGTITGLAASGGDDYLAWHWLCTEQAAINGDSIVLVAENPRRLVTLEVSSCFGAGACLHVVPTGTGTVCDPPVTPSYTGGTTGILQVSLDAAGSGYATFGREEPQWAASDFSCVYTPTFGDEMTDACGRSLWPVESFAITTVNTAPTQRDGWSLEWPVSHPEHSDEPFQAIVHTRQAPTVTAAAAGPGAGATFTVSVEEIGGQPRRWRVSSVSVDTGGSGYGAEAAVTFSVAARVGEYGHYVESAAAGVATVNGIGAITGVTITSAGAYYLDNGQPQSVEVLGGGKYYRENAALTPYVATPTVNVVQLSPSAGSGAAVSLTIGSDTGNLATFGKVTAAAITSQGSGYTLLGGPTNCVYSADFCDGDVSVELRLRGAGKAPDLVLTDSRVAPGNTTVLRCNTALGDCDELPAAATLLYGAQSGVTATIARNGAVDTPCSDPAWCSGCDCPADLVTPATVVDITSDFPCGGGTAAYSGPLGDLDFGCSCTVGGVTYVSDVSLQIVCCPSDCADGDECSLKVRGILSGLLGLPGDCGGGGWISSGGDADGDGNPHCAEATVVDGVVNATITIKWLGYTFTVVLGSG